MGKSVSGTITRDSDLYQDVENGYRCYINRYTIKVTEGREYTLRLWSDNGCVFETPDDYDGVFSEGDITSYRCFSTGEGETSTGRWVPREGGTIRVNIYSTTVPTDYEFTVSD